MSWKSVFSIYDLREDIQTKIVFVKTHWHPSFFQLFILYGTIANYFPGSSEGKVSAYNSEDPGSIPESGRSSEEGNGNPLQYSCLENPMDGGAW